MSAAKGPPEREEELMGVIAGMDQRPQCSPAARYQIDYPVDGFGGADVPNPEYCPVPLPAGGHLDADRHQLPGVSLSRATWNGTGLKYSCASSL